jgi:hypothetical protein
MEIRNMDASDRMRLKAHAPSHKLFRKLMSENSVAEMSSTEWRNLRTLVELGYVDIDDARVIVNFTISSLVELGYL